MSSNFYNEIIKLASENGADVILDETATCGGATGEGWWSWAATSNSPDFVVFGKRMQASGFFSKHNHFSPMNCGDPIKILQLKTMPTKENFSKVLRRRHTKK